jgi:hypothetical protein
MRVSGGVLRYFDTPWRISLSPKYNHHFIPSAESVAVDNMNIEVLLRSPANANAIEFEGKKNLYSY